MNLMRTNLLILIVLALAMAPRADACDVPVYAYAMDHWPADNYELLIFHRGKLDASRQELVDWLVKITPDTGEGPNLTVQVIDLATADAGKTPTTHAGETPTRGAGILPAETNDNGKAAGETPTPPLADESVAAAWKEVSTPTEPLLPWVVLRSSGRSPVAVWSGRLDAAAMHALVDSPQRREIAKRLMAKEAAVWVLLESGQKAADDAAAKILEEQSAKVAADCAQPQEQPTPDPEAEMQPARATLPPVKFSIVRLRRDDAKEAMFVQMLLGADKALAAAKGPIAFPIFGRGRALCGLAGEHLDAKTVAKACEFMVGDCSCQVKAQNPGVDLLMWTDWEQRPGGAANRELPPSMATLDQGPGAPPLMAAPAPQAFGSPLLRNLLLALGMLVAVVAVLVLVVSRKGRGAKAEDRRP